MGLPLSTGSSIHERKRARNDSDLRLARFCAVHHNRRMPTVEQLKMRRQDLQEKLDAGDLSVQTALDQIDRAISARTLKVRQSQQRLEAVKAAVASGMEIKTPRAASTTKVGASLRWPRRCMRLVRNGC